MKIINVDYYDQQLNFYQEMDKSHNNYWFCKEHAEDLCFACRRRHFQGISLD